MFPSLFDKDPQTVHGDLETSESQSLRLVKDVGQRKECIFGELFIQRILFAELIQNLVNSLEGFEDIVRSVLMTSKLQANVAELNTRRT